MEQEDFAKMEEIVKGLNVCEAERLKEEGFTNDCFFNADGSITENYKITMKEKKKYFYINFGTSGTFMVDKATGEVFGIKAYGQINRIRLKGNIRNLDIAELHKKRW